MSFIFRCPICKSEREAVDHLIGRRVRCADCDNFVQVLPGKGDQPPRVVADDGASEDDDEAEDVVDLQSGESQAAISDETDAPGAFALGAPLDDSIRSHADRTVEPLGKVGTTGETEEGSGSGSLASMSGGGSGDPVLVRWKEEPDENDPESNEPIKFKPEHDRESDMDMTPMVDVTFLLLIFFMVTASFTLQKSIEQPPQQEDEPSMQTIEPEQEADSILVYVDEFNTYQVFYGDNSWECPSEQELIVKLRDVKEDTTSGATPTDLLVMAHGDAFHEKVVTAMDAGTTVGMASIQVTMTETGP